MTRGKVAPGGGAEDGQRGEAAVPQRAVDVVDERDAAEHAVDGEPHVDDGDVAGGAPPRARDGWRADP